MLRGHSTLNTVVLGEGMSEYQIPPYFGHHSSSRPLARDPAHRRIDDRMRAIEAYREQIYSCRSMLKNNTKFKFSTIVTRTCISTNVITHGMLHGL